ncbi:hypothetical protein CBR_g8927 [Chara braunii]|uniref:Uncharacterized protein n=1 Tax=Chara braunii TaxID=69332 RepID=A0A388KN70_CHABU|nr:hypothetical protein CBR_g8927 [Chara braunii]|eukprot:GBG71510.1 hypothetical protein CBR_g8927 [Chara braunii]
MEMSMKLDKVCEAVGGKKNGESEEIKELKALVESLNRQCSMGGVMGRKSGNEDEVVRLREEVDRLRRRTDGASTSATITGAPREADELIQIRREQVEAKAAMDKRLATMEEVIFAMQKHWESVEANAEVWRNEALRPGNKRGSVAIGCTPINDARVRPKVTPVVAPSVAGKVNMQLKGLVERHKWEVDMLKEMRLREVNARKESEEEVERLKVEMARLETGKRPKGTNLKAKLDEAVGVSSKKDKGKCLVSPAKQACQREVFVREARKQLRNLKKEDIVGICKKEGVEYTTLNPTKEAIAQLRADRARLDACKDDVNGVSVVEVTEDGGDSSAKSNRHDSATS